MNELIEVSKIGKPIDWTQISWRGAGNSLIDRISADLSLFPLFIGAHGVVGVSAEHKLGPGRTHSASRCPSGFDGF